MQSDHARQAARYPFSTTMCKPRPNTGLKANDVGHQAHDPASECEHGRLPGDASQPCGCWAQQPYPMGVVPARDRRDRQTDKKGA